MFLSPSFRYLCYCSLSGERQENKRRRGHVNGSDIQVTNAYFCNSQLRPSCHSLRITTNEKAPGNCHRRTLTLSRPTQLAAVKTNPHFSLSSSEKCYPPLGLSLVVRRGISFHKPCFTVIFKCLFVSGQKNLNMQNSRASNVCNNTGLIDK